MVVRGPPARVGVLVTASEAKRTFNGQSESVPRAGAILGGTAVVTSSPKHVAKTMYLDVEFERARREGDRIEDNIVAIGVTIYGKLM